jgi:hypothetical protein
MCAKHLTLLTPRGLRVELKSTRAISKPSHASLFNLLE